MRTKELHTSKLFLSKSAVKSNLKFIRKIIGDKITLSSVVKGNAYGHGIEQFVPILADNGVRHFSVFSAMEAYRVKSIAPEDSEIMIMGWVSDEHVKWAIEEDIQFYVFELDRLKAAIESAKESKKKARIHIEIETGMNRTGFEEHVLDEVMELLKENQEHLVFEGLCTHYAGAESITNYIRIKNQIEKFHEIYDRFLDAGLKPKKRHTACSAAAISYPQTHMDMVRIGILTYGFWPSRETFIHHLRSHDQKKHKDPLERVISWKTQVMSVKGVEVGEFIGYGTSYLASQDMRIATVPVGYAYGFTRSLSNVGRVLIRGKRASVIGVVNMNLMIINATDVKDIQKGDEVVLIGAQKKRNITVSSFGEMSNQLNYELLSRLPADLPRNVIE